jgi:hypothetical protein
VSIAQHTLYFLVGVLVSLFLQLSVVCRFILLIAVAANVSLVYHRQPLGFLHLTGAIIGELMKCY